MVFDPSGGASRVLTGEIPPALGKLTGLVQLMLGDNQLTGGIPPSLANLTTLQQLFLSYNQLTGPIPSSLAALSNVGALVINCNRLSGALPAFAFDQAKICYANWVNGFGSKCAVDNTWACPLPEGAAEHCHATCQ